MESCPVCGADRATKIFSFLSRALTPGSSATPQRSRDNVYSRIRDFILNGSRQYPCLITVVNGRDGGGRHLVTDLMLENGLMPCSMPDGSRTRPIVLVNAEDCETFDSFAGARLQSLQSPWSNSGRCHRASELSSDFASLRTRLLIINDTHLFQSAKWPIDFFLAHLIKTGSVSVMLLGNSSTTRISRHQSHLQRFAVPPIFL